MHNSDILNLDENKFAHKKELSMKEKVLRDTQIRSMHEMGEMKRAQELRVDEVSVQKSRQNHAIQKLNFSVAGNAGGDEFYERFGRISRSGIKLQRETVLRFQSGCNRSKFSFHAEPRQTPDFLEYIGITGKRFFGNQFNFLRLIHPEIILKEFTLAHHKENKDQFHKQQRQGLFSQEMTNKIETQFQCRHLQKGRRL